MRVNELILIVSIEDCCNSRILRIMTHYSILRVHTILHMVYEHLIVYIEHIQTVSM